MAASAAAILALFFVVDVPGISNAGNQKTCQDFEIVELARRCGGSLVR